MTIPYAFPTEADAEEWREKVQQAIGKTLTWSRDPSMRDRWILSGICPRCGDEMRQLVPIGDIVLPDTFGGVESNTAGRREIEVEVVCDCSGQHKKDVSGCGFGKGIRVPLSRPE